MTLCVHVEAAADALMALRHPEAATVACPCCGHEAAIESPIGFSRVEGAYPVPSNGFACGLGGGLGVGL
jgi:hypothetical protein